MSTESYIRATAITARSDINRRQDLAVPGMSLPGVGQTYCLNLLQNMERNRYMRDHYPFEFRFLPGVYRPDGTTLQKRFPKLTQQQANQLSRGPTNSGEWGASFSHFNAWNQIARLDTWGIILEDDVILHDAVGLLGFATDELKSVNEWKDVGIIYIGGQWNPAYKPSDTIDTAYSPMQIPLNHHMKKFSTSTYDRAVGTASTLPKDLFDSYVFRTPAAMMMSPSYARFLVSKAEEDPYQYFSEAVDTWLVNVERNVAHQIHLDRFPHPLYQMSIGGDIEHINDHVSGGTPFTGVGPPGLMENTIAGYRTVLNMWAMSNTTVPTPVPTTVPTPVPTHTSGPTGGGDPYIYPLIGPAMKLPNVDEIYRLYEDTDVVVNAHVQKATPAIQREIEHLVQHSGLRVVGAEAYFFSHIFIGSRRDPDAYVTIDLEAKTVSGSTSHMFHVGASFLNTDVLPYDDGSHTHVSIPIHWGTDMCLLINFSRNPQVRNGVSLSGQSVTRSTSTGLLIRNYRPKLFRLCRLEDTACIQLPKKCVRLFTNRGTRATAEHRVKVVSHGFSSSAQKSKVGSHVHNRRHPEQVKHPCLPGVRPPKGALDRKWETQ